MTGWWTVLTGALQGHMQMKGRDKDEGPSSLGPKTQCAEHSGDQCDGGTPASITRLPHNPALTFAASGPRGRSAAGSPARRAPSATRGQTGTTPRSHPWHSLWGEQWGEPWSGSHSGLERVGGQPCLLPSSFSPSEDFTSLRPNVTRNQED